MILALHNYEAAYGHLPPAYLADTNGKPMHSWRVLILPFLENQDVYDRYDFDEPWNGPNNSRLVDKLGSNSTFFCPHQEGLRNRTTYKLITGPGTAFVNDKSISLGQILAGTSNTICIIEDTVNPVNWMEPVDLSVNDAVDLFDAKKHPESTLHVKENKFHRRHWYSGSYAFFDGSAGGFCQHNSPEKMTQWFQIDGVRSGDFHDVFCDWPSGGEMTKPFGYVLVLLNIALALLPLFWNSGVRQSRK